MTSRNQFGGDVSDFTYATQAAGGRLYMTLLPNTVTTFWSAQTGGAPYLDLLDANSNPVSSITSDANGSLPAFSGPAGITAMWADAGGGRRLIRPTGSGSSLDTDTSININNPASATSTALAATYAPKYDNGVMVFDPRFYGAKFDNATDDYTALANTIAAAAAVGRARISLPEGTAYLGKTGGGGLALPYAMSSLVIEGQGKNVTGFRLSAEVRRLFDLASASQTYSNIKIRNFFIDNNGIGAASIGAATTASSAVTLAGAGASTSLPVVSTAGWASAGVCFFPSSDTGTAAGSTLHFTLVDSTHISITNYGSSVTVASGDTVQGAISDHLIVGTAIDSGQTNAVNVNGLTVEDIDVLNVPTVQATSTFGKTGHLRWGWCIAPQGTPSSTLSLTGINFRRVNIYGGEAGGFVGSFGNTPQVYSAFLDDVNFEDCTHTTNSLPTINYFGLNFEIGGSAMGRRARIRNCKGWGSGDVGIEINAILDAKVIDCLIEESQGGEFYHANYGIAAETISGPPTMTLNADLTTGATSATIVSLPSESIPYSGYAVIDSEVVTYTITNGTTLAITRGFNGSTAAAHTVASGAVFKVLPVGKQKVKWIRCRSRKAQITPGTVGIMPKSFYATRGASCFPHATLVMRDCEADNTLPVMGYRTQNAEIVWVQGWCPMIDINGLDIQRHGINYTTLDGSVGAAMGVITDTGTSGPETVLRYDNVTVNATGVLASGASAPKYGCISFDAGNWVLDWGSVVMNLAMRSVQTQNTQGLLIQPMSGGAAFTLRGVIRRLRYIASGSLDGAPIAVLVSGVLTLKDLFIEVLDLDAMGFGQSSGNPNYQPIIAGAYAGGITVGSWRHPSAISSMYAQRSGRRRTAITATSYACAGSDEYLGVSAPSAAVAITLNPVKATGGSASPNPSVGREVWIKDEAANAATYNITVNAAAGETIDGASSKVINTNSGILKLMSIGSGWVSI